jgi:hypothetical protein
MQKVQKTYTQEFKREAVRLARQVASRLPKSPVSWAFPTAPPQSGARSWQNTALSPFEAVDTRRLWRKKTAGSNESWRERERPVIC